MPFRLTVREGHSEKYLAWGHALCMDLYSCVPWVDSINSYFDHTTVYFCDLFEKL